MRVTFGTSVSVLIWCRAGKGKAAQLTPGKDEPAHCKMGGPSGSCVRSGPYPGSPLLPGQPKGVVFSCLFFLPCYLQ